jgi:hypothetical protein
MTEYKITIPVKCSTLREASNVVEDVIILNIVGVALFAIGLFNALLAHVIFNYDDLASLVAAYGGSLAPYELVVGMYGFMVICIDGLAIVGILECCNVSITIDCIREKKSGRQ